MTQQITVNSDQVVEAFKEQVGQIAKVTKMTPEQKQFQKAVLRYEAERAKVTKATKKLDETTAQIKAYMVENNMTEQEVEQYMVTLTDTLTHSVNYLMAKSLIPAKHHNDEGLFSETASVRLNVKVKKAD